MRRFQCTNREFLAFTFREIYDEVECPEGFKRTHAESIFLVDDYGDVHEMWPRWIFNNFKELPGDELTTDPYALQTYYTDKINNQPLFTQGCAFAVVSLITIGLITWWALTWRS